MGFAYKFVLFSSWASAVFSAPAPGRGAESGGGIAPGAGTGAKPKPAPQVQAAKGASQAAGAVSSVPYGTIIDSCTVPGTVALTFDDGPYIYTAQVLDILKNNNVRATFFMNGDNWSNILSADDQALVHRVIAEGHQIGSHT